jgi:hypothetical protein
MQGVVVAASVKKLSYTSKSFCSNVHGDIYLPPSRAASHIFKLRK